MRDMLDKQCDADTKAWLHEKADFARDTEGIFVTKHTLYWE